MTRRYVIDADAIERARLHLGIDKPVHAVVRRYRYRYGRYIGERDGTHVIGVSSDIGRHQANRTLWHELAHVRQAEQLGGLEAFDRRWFEEMRQAGIPRSKAIRARGRGYPRTPLEREARRVERLAKRHPLVRY